MASIPCLAKDGHQVGGGGRGIQTRAGDAGHAVPAALLLHAIIPT